MSLNYAAGLHRTEEVAFEPLTQSLRTLIIADFPNPGGQTLLNPSLHNTLKFRWEHSPTLTPTTTLAY